MGERANALFEFPAPHVAHLRCQQCTSRACETMAALPGVLHTECSATDASVSVEFDPAVVTEAELQSALERFGMRLAESHRHAAWRVTGLD